MKYLITKNTITITLEDGSVKIVRKEDPIFEKVAQATRQELWDLVEKLLAPEQRIKHLSDGRIRVEDGLCWIKDGEEEFPAHAELNSTIMAYLDQGLPVDPLARFASNLRQNPSKHSLQQLFTFLDHNHLTITEDGKFIAYKKVRSDFLDFYTGKMDNSIGKTVTMERSAVADNPETTCSNGLHCSSMAYCRDSYHPGQGVIVYVEVNPRDVVSVPVDHNNSKIRVCEYIVKGVISEEFKETLLKNNE